MTRLHDADGGPDTVSTQSGTYVPVSQAQAAEGALVTQATILPFTAATAPYAVVYDSFANSGGNGYNHAVWMGYNPVRRATGGGTAQAFWVMGLEDNFWDGSNFGPEWYIEYGSANGVVTGARPYYARLAVVTASTWFSQVKIDIGAAAGGYLLVMADNGTGNNLWGLSGTGSGSNTVMSCYAPTGQKFVQTGYINGVAKFGLQWAVAGAESQLEIWDNNRARQQMLMWGGTNDLNAQTYFKSSVFVTGTLQLGTQTGTPTLAGTGNLGTGAPAPVLVAGSNAIRGTVQLGTGTAPSAGALVTVTFATALASTPAAVIITAVNFTSGAVPFFVDSISATSFRIGANATPTAGQAVPYMTIEYLVIL